MASYGPNLTVGDIIQVKSVCFSVDQLGLNIFHYIVTAVIGTPKLSDVVASLEGGPLGPTPFSTNMKALLCSAASFRGYAVRVLYPTMSVEFLDTSGVGNGTVAGDLLPRQVAGLISKRAAVPGRRMGGRFYVPFPGEADNTAASVPSSDYVDRLGALRITLSSSLVKGSDIFADPVIGLKTVVAGISAIRATRSIGSWVERSLWATQRRRGSYGRTNTSPL